MRESWLDVTPIGSSNHHSGSPAYASPSRSIVGSSIIKALEAMDEAVG